VWTELRVATITTRAAANAYLREHFIPAHNVTFNCAPVDPASAFVAVGRVDLDQMVKRMVDSRDVGLT
jgi:hypothetical protein